jgi:Zn-dependent peptidase ImmA (M78 family)
MPGPVTDPRADALRLRYHALFGGDELPVPVDEIAEDLLGLSVGEADELDVSGLLLPAQREIWLNGREARESPGRRRFTLAHELGHWICHCLAGRTAPMYCRSDQVGLPNGEVRQLEREANVFAAELLMPERLIRKSYKGSQRLDDVAAHLGVSKDAMGWRLFNLGLVSETPF